jgi:hypothetical protein
MTKESFAYVPAEGLAAFASAVTNGLSLLAQVR